MIVYDSAFEALYWKKRSLRQEADIEEVARRTSLNNSRHALSYSNRYEMTPTMSSFASDGGNLKRPAHNPYGKPSCDVDTTFDAQARVERAPVARMINPVPLKPVFHNELQRRSRDVSEDPDNIYVASDVTGSGGGRPTGNDYDSPSPGTLDSVNEALHQAARDMIHTPKLACQALNSTPKRLRSDAFESVVYSERSQKQRRTTSYAQQALVITLKLSPSKLGAILSKHVPQPVSHSRHASDHQRSAGPLHLFEQNNVLQQSAISTAGHQSQVNDYLQDPKLGENARIPIDLTQEDGGQDIPANQPLVYSQLQNDASSLQSGYSEPRMDADADDSPPSQASTPMQSVRNNADVSKVENNGESTFSTTLPSLISPPISNDDMRGVSIEQCSLIQDPVSTGQSHIKPEDSLGVDHERIKTESKEDYETDTRRPSGLERAKVLVYWEVESDCPDLINLRSCKSHQDLFTQLERHKPQFAHQANIKAAEVRLTNANAAGIDESPNCRILGDDGEDAFEHLTEILANYTPDVRPKLKLTIEFWE